MSYRWRRSVGGEQCGAVPDCRVPRGEPIREQWIHCQPDTPGNQPLLRCQTHADTPVPEDLPLLEERPPVTFEPTPAERDRVYRHPRPRPAEVAGMTTFDPKMAQAGRDDE